jgi:CubicO group peptidase (beta-lactamase class C family)
MVGDDPPGLSIVITLGGDVLYCKGFGMADGPNEMASEPDTVYMWGSLTKIVTGVAIMQLVDHMNVVSQRTGSCLQNCDPIT